MCIVINSSSYSSRFATGEVGLIVCSSTSMEDVPAAGTFTVDDTLTVRIDAWQLMPPDGGYHRRHHVASTFNLFVANVVGFGILTSVMYTITDLICRLLCTPLLTSCGALAPRFPRTNRCILLASLAECVGRLALPDAYRDYVRDQVRQVDDAQVHDREPHGRGDDQVVQGPTAPSRHGT